MKMFTNPKLEVVKFDIADVITTSGGQISESDTELPDDEF